MSSKLKRPSELDLKEKKKPVTVEMGVHCWVDCLVR